MITSHKERNGWRILSQNIVWEEGNCNMKWQACRGECKSLKRVANKIKKIYRNKLQIKMNSETSCNQIIFCNKLYTNHFRIELQ